MRKKLKLEDLLVLIFISIYLIGNIIGYIFDIEILITSIKDDNGYTINFIPIYISLVLTSLFHLLYKLNKAIKKSKKVI